MIGSTYQVPKVTLFHFKELLNLIGLSLVFNKIYLLIKFEFLSLNFPLLLQFLWTGKSVNLVEHLIQVELWEANLDCAVRDKNQVKVTRWESDWDYMTRMEIGIVRIQSSGLIESTY